MRNYISKLCSRGIMRSFLTLVSGTVIAQLFSLIFYPILGRMFLPGEFGLLSMLSTVSTIIAVVASGKFEQAIIITKSREEAVNVLSIALSCAIFTCALILVGVYFFSESVLITVNQPLLIGWIYLSPFIALFIVIYNSFNEWCVKKSGFKSLAINKITNSASLSLSKFLLGSISCTGGLLLGELLGRALSAFSCVFHWIRVDRADFKLVSWSRMKALALQHVNFPKYTMPDQIINTLTGSLSIFFIGSYFGESNLGYYAMTQNVLAIPATFVGQAVTDVFRNRASQDFDEKGNCRALYNQLLKKMIPTVILTLLGIIYFLPSIFVLVLGEQWREAGKIAQIISPAIATGFICNAFMSVWIIAGKLKQRFYWQLFYFLVIFLSMIVGCVIFRDVKITLIAFSIGLSMAYGVSIYFTWMFSKGNQKEIRV